MPPLLTNIAAPLATTAFASLPATASVPPDETVVPVSLPPWAKVTVPPKLVTVLPP